MADVIAPTCFTYAAFKPLDDLQQGDILQPTDSLLAVFKEVHPYFVDEKYTAFMVLTQTCDLVRRKDGGCKTDYVNVAVIRRLSDLLFSLLDKRCRPVTEGVYLKEDSGSARQLLVSVFNQNERALGLFYLHPDVAVSIAEPSVAMLQVSIALRAGEHYKELVAARTGRVADVFQAQLGWLVGHLFSRVATRDWEEHETKDMAGELLEQAKWVRRKDLKKMQMEAGVAVEGMSRVDFESLCETYMPPPPKARAIDRVLSILVEQAPQISPGALRKIGNALSDDGEFKSVFT